MTLTAGSLCSGVGGLELGLERALGARTVWQSEIDPHASTVLTHHWPSVPNLGDLTAVNWAGVESVDVLCAGFPCQPVSQAGRRNGVNDDRWLWDDIAAALGRMDPRPRLLLLENVTGLLTANDGHAMARIVHGLASLGYVGRYRVLGSRDVGAVHRRERVFIAAAHAGGAGTGRHPGTLPGTARADGRGLRSAADADPAAAHANRGARAARNAEPGVSSTPLVRRGASASTGRGSAVADADHKRRPPHQRQEHRRGQRPDTGTSSDPVADTDSERLTLWPELDSDPETRIEPPRRDDPDGRDLWGPYAPAIRRWEAIHGAAPQPRDDRGRLNPQLPEWMLGFEHGWVTSPELGLPRTTQFRLLGNSVQPGVAELAAQLLLAPLLTLEAD